MSGDVELRAIERRLRHWDPTAVGELERLLRREDPRVTEMKLYAEVMKLDAWVADALKVANGVLKRQAVTRTRFAEHLHDFTRLPHYLRWSHRLVMGEEPLPMLPWPRHRVHVGFSRLPTGLEITTRRVRRYGPLSEPEIEPETVRQIVVPEPAARLWSERNR